LPRWREQKLLVGSQSPTPAIKTHISINTIVEISFSHIHGSLAEMSQDTMAKKQIKGAYKLSKFYVHCIDNIIAFKLL
jgi:hypothetical protein